jgi:hypothetical protein
VSTGPSLLYRNIVLPKKKNKRNRNKNNSGLDSQTMKYFKLKEGPGTHQTYVEVLLSSLLCCTCNVDRVCRWKLLDSFSRKRRGTMP